VRRLSKLRWFPSAAKSPWSWPIFALVAVAAVGQWAGVTVAEAVAAGFGAIGIGVAIGLAVAGKLEDRREHSGDRRQPSDASAYEARATGGLPPADRDPKEPSPHSRRTVDLRGARLVNAMLVGADLRQADLRGATLTGADLSGADLTGAQLGPLDEGSSDERSA
jgi:Pentapeptide repeats (8 copies)